MTPYEEAKAGILKVLMTRKALVVADDGYYVYWPSIDGSYGYGYQTAEELRIVADILDEKNKAWDKEVRRELGNERDHLPYDMWW